MDWRLLPKAEQLLLDVLGTDFPEVPYDRREAVARRLSADPKFRDHTRPRDQVIRAVAERLALSGERYGCAPIGRGDPRIVARSLSHALPPVGDELAAARDDNRRLTERTPAAAPRDESGRFTPSTDPAGLYPRNPL